MTVPSVIEMDEVLDNLRRAIINENRDVVRNIVTNYRKHLPADIKFSQFPNDINISSLKVDTLSSCLLPRDILQNLVPVKVTGNGDCFFNSASLFLVGNESLCSVLRLLTAAEIFLHTEFYAYHTR